MAEMNADAGPDLNAGRGQCQGDQEDVDVRIVTTPTKLAEQTRLLVQVAENKHIFCRSTSIQAVL